MKFDMGSQVLSNLQSKSRGSSEDLGGLIRQLVDAAAPLEGKFNGSGKAAFDQFKARSDEIASSLQSSLSANRDGPLILRRCPVAGPSS